MQTRKQKPRSPRSPVQRLVMPLRGFKIGWRWVFGGDGPPSRNSAIIASYHHPESITWRWALYWSRDTSGRAWARIFRHEYGYVQFSLPLVGGLRLSWQPHMMRRAEAA